MGGKVAVKWVAALGAVAACAAALAALASQPWGRQWAELSLVVRQAEAIADAIEGRGPALLTVPVRVESAPVVLEVALPGEPPLVVSGEYDRLVLRAPVHRFAIIRGWGARKPSRAPVYVSRAGRSEDLTAIPSADVAVRVYQVGYEVVVDPRPALAYARTDSGRVEVACGGQVVTQVFEVNRTVHALTLVLVRAPREGLRGGALLECTGWYAYVRSCYHACAHSGVARVYLSGEEVASFPVESGDLVVVSVVVTHLRCVPLRAPEQSHGG